MDKTYSFPRVAVMLALSIVLGLGAAKCTTETGDTNPRPNCGTAPDGNLDCKPQIEPSPKGNK